MTRQLAVRRRLWTAKELANFAFLLPFYLLHESAHAVAFVMFSDVHGAGVVLDFDRDGLARHSPVGCFVHGRPIEGVRGWVVGLAPASWLVPAYAIQPLITQTTIVESPVLFGVWLLLLGAGLGVLSDVMYIADGVFDLDLVPDVDELEHRYLIGGPPPESDHA